MRERSEDVPTLAVKFVEVSAQRNHKHISGLTPGAMELLSHLEWPGNVRQLQNEIERAVLLAREDEIITPDHFSPELTDSMAVQSIRQEAASETSGELTPQSSTITTANAPGSVPRGLREAHQYFDRRFVCETLAKTQGNISRTAVALGISRIALQKKLRHYGLR